MRPTSHLPTTGAGGPTGSLTLRRHPAEAERARRFVAAACTGYAEDAVVTATLLASELITNALEHGAGEITVLVSRTARRLRVAVVDESDAGPVPRFAGPDEEGGRGLLMVEALAEAWGVDPLPLGNGKTVWFVLRAA